eukprot:403361614
MDKNNNAAFPNSEIELNSKGNNIENHADYNYEQRLIDQNDKELQPNQGPQSNAEIKLEKKEKIDPRFWIYSIGACIIFASSAIFRAFHGKNVLLTNTIVNLSFGLVSFLYFGVKIISAKIHKEQYNLPWVIKNGTTGQNKVSWVLFLCLFIGGSVEYFGNQSLILSFKYALYAGFNQGICSAMVSTNTVYVALMSFIIFREKLKGIQVAGILCMIFAVGIVSLFKTETEDFDQIHVHTVQETDDLGQNKAITIFGGLFASIMFGSQLLLFKFVLRYTHDTFGIAFAFLLLSSVYGFGNLFYLLSFNRDAFFENDFLQNISSVLTGILLSLAIVLVNVSCSFGLIGITNAIMHCQTIIVTVFNYLVFSQDLNMAQSVGVGLCVIGALIISNGDRLSCCNSKIKN